MGSPLTSLAICAYAFVREQCDIVAALFEFVWLQRRHAVRMDHVSWQECREE